jgi:hypothetical protein
LVLDILQTILPLTELSIDGTVQYLLQYSQDLAVIQKLESLGLFKKLSEDDRSGVTSLNYLDVPLIKDVIGQLNDRKQGVLSMTEEEFRELREDYKKTTMHRKSPSLENNEETNEPLWQNDFRWEGKSFVFGEYGSITGFQSKNTLKLFQALTDAKGHWVLVRKLCNVLDKDTGYTRTTIGHIEKRFDANLRRYIEIPSTDDDNFPPKPSKGAYRIKFTPKPL